MALEMIPSDARIIAAEDEWLRLSEQDAEPSTPLLSEPTRPTGEQLLARADALAHHATRWSCAYCASEVVAGGRRLGTCSTCCSPTPAWVPTKLADDLELKLGGRVRPFTHYPPAA